jgi:histidine triad (HIT) family protein
VTDLRAVPSALDDPHPDDCVFCGIVDGRLPGRRLLEDERTVSFLDLNPATRGHALVVPRTHARDLMAIDPADLAACAVTAQRLAAMAVERLGATGVNLLNACGTTAWQSVPHFHLHVVPRYEAVRPPWTPTPGAAPDLDEVWAALRDG